MAKAFIDDTHLTDIADAIRATLDESRQYLPSEMAAAIQSIPIMAQLNRKKYFQAVPAGAASGYANIEKIEGNTVAWNQLLKQGKLVDMGLPSGLLWATCNIDITQEDGFAASPFQYDCSFFSWGNIDGHNPISNNAFDYNWGGVNAQQPWYEGQPYGSTPGSTLAADIVAGDTYDAARYNVGSLFKMPTSAQFKELIDNCDFVQADGTTVIASSVTDKRVTVNGIVGIYLKSKVNGNLIFFSASGSGYDASWYDRGSYGCYWSASFFSARYARSLYFYSGGVNPQSGSSRYLGFAVRAIVNPNTIDTGHNNHKYYVTKDINHDLTAIFGSGNEPTTVAEFEAWLAQNIGTLLYYDYNAGELLSVKMSGMQTEDSSQQTLDTLPFDVTTITGINPNTNTREVIFPNGMKQADRAGTVKDEIDLMNGTATVKCGIVDLGDLSGWQYRGPDCPNILSIDVTSSVLYKRKEYAINYICDRYTSHISVIGILQFFRDAPNMSISVYVGTVNSRIIYINDNSIVASDIDNQGKIAKLNGVLLYYELATPITYTDLQDANGNPLNPRYKVEQGGTEQVLPVNTSTPTTVAPTLTTIYKKNI